MRCEICGKVMGSRYGYESHVRMSHKEISSEERREMFMRLFPRNDKLAKYGELKDKVQAGELLTKEEFAIVRARDQRHNRHKAKCYL